MKICDEGARSLASAVLVQTVKDIRAQRLTKHRHAEYDVLNGGIDLYLGLMNVDIEAEAFIKRAKEDGK